MRTPLESNIECDIEHLEPLGDLVLVKQIPRDEGLIAAPGRVQISDGRWVDADPSGLRRGVVLAVGPGDPLVVLRCTACGKERKKIATPTYTHEMSIRSDVRMGVCACGHKLAEIVGREHRPMGVKVGDEVLYTRVPANNVRLNQQYSFSRDEYVFLHEEQHIFAVIEKENDVTSLAA